ncbi:MAG: hypothetical protein JXQ75_11195 [Phycisphaerae bacterium]|nr:hypothetical protein [Phycisphaerae bacterium]
MLPDTIKTRGFHAGVRFAPHALLDKHHKQQFQLKSSEGFDWRRQEFTDKGWYLLSPQAEGDPRSQLKLSVQPDLMNFEDYFPTGPLDVFCDNMKLALECVASVFNPKIIVGSGAIIRITAQSEGKDARVFLGQQCLHLDDRLGPLRRPVHAVGLKMLLPPLPGKDKPNWQVEVKIESLVEDVRQLFVEVDARWANPSSWDPQVVVDRIRTAHDFATHEVVDFLQQLGHGGEP